MAPVLLAIALTAVFGGRITEAESRVYAAANAAARAGTLARTQAAAAGAAQQAATAALGTTSVTCRQLTTAVDTTAFRPGGFVTVTLRCSVDVSDLVGVTLLPGAVSVDGSATAPVDVYRGTR